MLSPMRYGLGAGVRQLTVEGSAGCNWELLSDALADAIRPWSRSDSVVGAEGPSAIEGLNRGSGRSEPFGRAPTDASLPIGVLQATATLYGPGRGVSGIIIETNRGLPVRGMHPEYRVGLPAVYAREP